MPIPDTPYMISLSVVYPEVTKTADDMLSRLSFGVQFAVSFSFGKLACALDLARMPRVQAQRAARRVSRVRHARGPDRKREGRGSGGGRRGEAAGE